MKTISLSKPVMGARGPVSQLTFREPVFADLVEFGEPETPIFQGESMLWQQHAVIIGMYARRLLKDEDVNVLDHVALKDSLAIWGAVIGFFREAARSDPPVSDTPTT